MENRIERCLQLYMNKKEVVNTLIKQDNIDPRFTDIGSFLFVFLTDTHP